MEILSIQKSATVNVKKKKNLIKAHLAKNKLTPCIKIMKVEEQFITVCLMWTKSRGLE